MALEQPALRRLQEKKFGVKETERLKRGMFIADMQRDEFLHGYLRRRFPDASLDELADFVLGVYQNGLKQMAAVVTSETEDRKIH